MLSNEELLAVLLHQREHHVDDSVYKMIQCDFAYNSNHMEGSRLTPEQTQMVFGRKTISGDNIALDDILEAMNHFEAFDAILDRFDEPLSEDLILSLHRTLKNGTTQAKNPLYSVGAYKRYENVIGDECIATTEPDKVADEINGLLGRYERQHGHDFDDLLTFHVTFERIHPFSDGNGRVGRLLLFKECLRNDITPYIITDDLHDFYIRGLRNSDSERGWLRDTCLTAQDRFIARYLSIAESYACAMKEVELSQTIPDDPVRAGKQESLEDDMAPLVDAAHDAGGEAEEPERAR